MHPIHRILFAVKDPSAARQPGIAKAVGIAKALGATLELFHALTSPVFLDLAPITGDSLESLRRKAIEHAKARLARHVASARKRGVVVECSVDWDYPPHEAVVRRADATHADLIIAECHKGSRAAAWLIHLTDWEIMRASAQPVLLLKSRKSYRRPLTLAAVDPGHKHAKPLALDAKIVSWAQQFSKCLGGSMHVMHASDPSTFGLALGDPAISGAELMLTYDDLKKEAAGQFKEFVSRTALSKSRAHLVDGHPAVAIPRLVRKLGADLVVMGAVSRSGLKRMFIGNTAERVLNALPCDILVVKPDGFESRVSDQSRGMRVLASPPISPLLS